MPLAREIRDIPQDLNDTLKMFENRFPHGLDKSYMQTFKHNWSLEHMSIWRELAATIDASSQPEFENILQASLNRTAKGIDLIESV